MALWDDFGKKAGETARNFGVRAREVAETTKLNGQIAIKKTEAERLYVDIGKAYCAFRAGKDAEDLEGLCEKVKGICSEIDQIQAQIDVIRQVRRCPACGEVSSITSNFCSSCGARFEETPQPVPEKEEPPAAEGVEIEWPEAEAPEEEKKEKQ